MKKLNVIFENEHLIVVNKPAGLVVNRSQTINEETLQDRLADYFKLGRGELGIGDRAGIVHRLDRETSGLVVVAKNQNAFRSLQTQFKLRQVEKEYVALVHGRVPNEGKIDERIGRVGKFGKFGIVDGGRESVTHFKRISVLRMRLPKFRKIVEENNLNRVRVKYLMGQAFDYSLISVFPKTGRTHQIRVHLKHISHPVVSDTLYCPGKLLKFDLLWCQRLFLHAAGIKFQDPAGGKLLTFSADLPNDLKSAMLFLAPEA